MMQSDGPCCVLLQRRTARPVTVFYILRLKSNNSQRMMEGVSAAEEFSWAIFTPHDSDVAAMCHTHTRSRRKTQLIEDLLSTFCPLIEETFSDSPPRLSELHHYHHHSVSSQTLPSSSSIFLIVSQDWLYCQ
ncbi:hypothetical protein ABVT39_007664 [Epinephelus coioides]